jgi:hypothetical protein
MKNLIEQIQFLERRADATSALNEFEEGVEKIEDALKSLPNLDSLLLGKLKNDLKSLQKHKAELEKAMLDSIWDVW